MLINHSSNGCTVNGRKIKKDKPHVLRSGDVIGVGKTTLFAVEFMEPEAPAVGSGAELTEPEAKAVAEARARTAKARLWIGVGSFWVLVLLIIIIAQMLGGPEKGTKETNDDKAMTESQIMSMLRQPLKRTPEEAQALRNLAKAESGYRAISGNPRADALYRIHYDYKQALAFFGAKSFNDIKKNEVQIRYTNVESMLAKKIWRKYSRGHERMLMSEYEDAKRDFNGVQDMYPESQSLIHDRIHAHFRHIEVQQSKGKNKKKRRF